MKDLKQIEKKASRIKLLVCDVDGVFTDATIYVGTSGELKKFSIKDGVGIALARHANLHIALLSGRHSEATTIRANELGIGDHVYQGYLNKIVAMKDILEKFDVTKEEAAYIGDDYVDLPVLRQVGFALTVPNGREIVKQEADFILNTPGGEGAVSEAVELILQARGELKSVMESMEKEKYMADTRL